MIGFLLEFTHYKMTLFFFPGEPSPRSHSCHVLVELVHVARERREYIDVFAEGHFGRSETQVPEDVFVGIHETANDPSLLLHEIYEITDVHRL